jgi:hypothetical protein
LKGFSLGAGVGLADGHVAKRVHGWRKAELGKAESGGIGKMSASLDKSQTQPSPTGTLPKPYLTQAGDLVIPNNSDPKYHWWKQGGQKVNKTMAEVRATAG